MKPKRAFPPSTQAMQYAALMKVVPFASERLRFTALVGAWQAGYRAGRKAARALTAQEKSLERRIR